MGRFREVKKYEASKLLTNGQKTIYSVRVCVHMRRRERKKGEDNKTNEASAKKMMRRVMIIWDFLVPCLQFLTKVRFTINKNK